MLPQMIFPNKTTNSSSVTTKNSAPIDFGVEMDLLVTSQLVNSLVVFLAAVGIAVEALGWSIEISYHQV